MISKNEFNQDLKPKDREVSFGIFMLRDLGVKTESNKKVKFKFLHANYSSTELFTVIYLYKIFRFKINSVLYYKTM